MTTTCANRICNTEEDERAFLDALSYAHEVSIRLIERRDPQNCMQGIFSVELTCKALPGSREVSFVLTKDGIRNPASSWPAFTYQVDDSQCDLLWNRLLPALKDTPNLQTLTLQGCARIPAFYTCLLQTITVSSLTTLNLASWVDFSLSVDWTVATCRLKQLKHLSVVYYKWDEISARDMGTMLSNLGGGLETLNLKTGTMPAEFWTAMRDGLQGSESLRHLSWRGNLESAQGGGGDEVQKTAAASASAMEQVCRTLSSLRQLTKLELAWNVLPCSCIEALSSSQKFGMHLSVLSLAAVDTAGAQVLGEFLEANRSLTTLEVALSDHCTDATRLLDGVMRHSALVNVSLSNVTMDNDAAKTILKLLVYNNVVQDFALASRNMDSQYLQDILMGLQYNAVIQSARFPSPSYTLNLNSCSALQDLLVRNTTLLDLHLGDCQIPTSDDDCTLALARGIVVNTTLRRLGGLICAKATASVRSIMAEALESNMTVVEFPFIPNSAATKEATTQSTVVSIPSVTPTNQKTLPSETHYPHDFFLDLNKMGRKHILSPNVLDVALIPRVLEKTSSPDQLYYLLQARVDWFRREI